MAANCNETYQLNPMHRMLIVAHLNDQKKKGFGPMRIADISRWLQLYGPTYDSSAGPCIKTMTVIFRANRRSRAQETGTPSPAFLFVALMDSSSYIYAQAITHDGFPSIAL